MFPKGVGEDVVPVIYDNLRQTMQLVDRVKKKLSHLRSNKRMRERHEMCILCEFIYKHHNDTKPVGSGQPLDEVHICTPLPIHESTPVMVEEAPGS